MTDQSLQVRILQDTGEKNTTPLDAIPEEERYPLIVFFVFFGLFIGGILREVNKKTAFPYTPMVVVVGILIGRFDQSLGYIGDSTIILSHINPHMLLFIFIPVLIFESGFNSSWYVFKRAIVNIIILAAPGVLWGAIMLGVVFRVILNYNDDDMTWYGAFMIGSVLSATDPVAVVALLKELGASIQFNTLIEGEALLNDGTAMVFYQLFLVLTKGQTASAAAVLLNFVRNAGGGPICGVIMGIAGSLWLRRIIRDDVLTSTLTFMCCYLCFFFAEFTFVHVSGILSIVSLGLFMSAFGKTNIYPESEHAVHIVWSFVQYCCETLIFLLTGLLIGIEMLEQPTIQVIDWFKLIVFWVMCHVVRFIMVVTFLPILTKYGYGINKKEFIVLIYGGLRGALGLTLSLMVGVDRDLPTRLRQLCIFYMAGTATLTLLINGTTCRSLVDYLQMIEHPPIKTKILKNSLKDLLNKSNDKEQQLKTNKYLQLAEWHQVEKIIGLDELEKNVQNLDIQSVNKGYDTAYDGIKLDEIFSETRFRLLRTLKGLIWERYEQGGQSSEATRMLEEAINVALDRTSEQIQIWENIYVNFTSFKTVKLLFKLKNMYFFGDLARSHITRHLAFIYEVTIAFIQCGLEASEMHEQDHQPIAKDNFHKSIGELKVEINKAEDYVSHLSQVFPDIIRSIHTKRAAYSILDHHKKLLNEYKNKGFIDDSDYGDLRKDLDRRIIQLENMVFEWGEPNFQLFVIEYPVFHSLTPEELKKIQETMEEKHIKKFQALYSKGNEFSYVYIVTQGTVEDEISEDYSIRVGIGSLLSFGNLIRGRNEAISTALCLQDATVMQIPYKVIAQIIQDNPEFEEIVFRRSMIYNVKQNPKTAGPLLFLTESVLTDIVSQSEFIRLDPQATILLENGGYIILGEIQNNISQEELLSRDLEKYGSFTYVPADNREYVVTKDTVILQFNQLLQKKSTYKNPLINLEVEENIEKEYDKYLARDSDKQGYKINVIQNQEQETEMQNLPQSQ